MEETKKPVLTLLKNPTPENVIRFFEILVGREATEEEIEILRNRLKKKAGAAD